LAVSKCSSTFVETKTKTVMKTQRFNLVLNEEQIKYLLRAIECYNDNENQVDDPDEKSLAVLEKIEKRLLKNY